MTVRPALFVELCAGTAAVSLALHGGLGCRPPVSRMGNKAGYALAILRVLGLRPGQGADAYLWCEPDPGCRALLHAYADRQLMREAAAIVRSWAGEEPRAVWERLKAEGPLRVNDSAQELARWARILTCNRLINPDPETWQNTGRGGSTFGGEEFCTPAPALADAFDDAAVGIPGKIVADNRLVSPEELARGFVLGTWAYRKGEPDPGFNAAATRERPATATDHGSGGRDAGMEADLLRRADVGAQGVVLPDAARFPPGSVIVYIDPPYQGTTGYGADLLRADVLDLAQRWADAGAVVAVSEAEPLDLGSGWQHVRIDGARRGQKRTFSKQQEEWITINREPAYVVPTQGALFNLGTRA